MRRASPIRPRLPRQALAVSAASGHASAPRRPAQRARWRLLSLRSPLLWRDAPPPAAWVVMARTGRRIVAITWASLAMAALQGTPPALATPAAGSSVVAHARPSAQATAVAAAPAPAAPEAAAAASDPSDLGEAKGLGRPPLDAWVTVSAYWPRRSLAKNAMAAGVLRRGDRVKVLTCTPRCDAKRPWGLLEGGAAVPLRYLAPLPLPPELARAVDFDARRGARVWAWKANVYAKPNKGAKILRKERNAYLVTFVPNPDAPEGWLQRPDGGWMMAKDVRMATPSRFQGVDRPTLPLMFVMHRILARELVGGPGAEQRKELLARARKKVRGKPADPEAVAAVAALALPRYHTAPVQAVRGGRVILADGTSLPKWKTRIAWLRQRPASIQPTTMWLHIDLEQQALVVYRGDTPLRATLVSTGKDGGLTSTKDGVFRALSKVRMSNMAGRVPEPYLAEGVPFVTHFYQGQALHAAWWHDGFGGKRSHGCVNMAPLDARWLYDNSPPQVPAGWRGVLMGGKDERLAIVIEKKTPTGARARRDPPERVDRRCVERDGERDADCPFDGFEGNDPDAADPAPAP